MEETKRNRYLILAISIVLPLVIALLYFAPQLNTSMSFSFLPAVNATINGTTFLVLLLALNAIRRKNIVVHKRLMWLALSLSVLFLVSYVVYHSTSASTPYGGDGVLRSVYFFVLISHILLSIAIVPLVLVTLLKALSEKFDQHRKIAKITLPIWLYVTLTGVIVYFMIAPYYS